MNDLDASESEGRVSVTTLRELGWAGLAGALGLLWFLRGVFLSRFALIPGDRLDGRFNAYLLEHSWGWISGHPLHRSLWDLPIFFPRGDNALAYSDLMVSFAPFYWPWRALGLSPETSYQLWILTVLWVSVLATFAFLRWGIGLSLAAAVPASLLATFAASRLAHLPHSQLLPTFFLALGLLAVARYGTSPDRQSGRRWLLLLAACAVAQLWGGFYLAFFLAVVVVALAAVALLFADTRRALLGRLRRDVVSLLAVGGGVALAVTPVAVRYARASAEVDPRSWEEIASMLPRLQSWVYMTSESLLYGRLAGMPIFSELTAWWEHAVGLGALTTLLVVFGWVVGWRRPAVRLSAMVALALMAVTTLWPGGFTVWEGIVKLPGVSALRAVARFGLLLPLVAAISLGTLEQWSRWGRHRWLALTLLWLAVAEQSSSPAYVVKATQQGWVSELAEHIEPNYRAFVATTTFRGTPIWVVTIDAMWAATVAGVPTVNGASGNWPPGWRGALADPFSGREHARERFLEDLEQWLSGHGVPLAEVQWVELPQEYRRGRPPAR